MDKNISIEQQFNDLNNSEITVKKVSPFTALALFVAGLIFILLSFTVTEGISGFINPMLTTLAVIFILWGALAFFFRKKRFIYTADNQVVKIKEFYFHIQGRDKLVKMITSSNFSELNKLEKATQDALKLRVAYTENYSFCAAQVVVFVPYEYVNTTSVLRLPEQQAKLIIENML